MSLIPAQDIKKLLKLNKLGFFGNGITWMFMQYLGINKVNKIYDKLQNLPSKEFLDQLINELGAKYHVHEEDLKRIPETGPFIIVANHPLGALEGILLLKIVLAVRPDFKVLGNFLLHKIVPLKPVVVAVNPFETRRDAYDNKIGIIQAYKHLKEGGCLGVFPAGEVSRYNSETKELQDREWIENGLKIIKNAKVPVIPVYFHAHNRKYFYQAHRIHPDLQTAFIPKEMVNPPKQIVQVRIGKPISVKQQNEFEDIKEYGNFLRKKVYMLKAFYDVKKNPFKNIRFLTVSGIMKSANSNEVKPIIEGTDNNLIKKEIEFLREMDTLLFQNNNYEIFFSKAHQIPNILREIGRLREITFREVGEGTNEPFDLDEFDQFYRHLFLWDNEKQVIVGAYRMGMGKEIFDKYGINGFYTSSLFEYDSELYSFFNTAIEMGRAFVINEYQQKPMPLFLLWRGIVHVCLKYSNHKYLIGGVSISNKFSKFSKSLMVEFMRSHYFDPFVAQFVHPKNEFKVKINEIDKDVFFDEAEDDLNKFDKLIDELEPSLRLPVLIKKYFKQNARVIAFNVDPKFNDSIDGLMYIRIKDLPEETIRPVLEELQQAAERKSHSTEE